MAIDDERDVVRANTDVFESCLDGDRARVIARASRRQVSRSPCRTKWSTGCLSCGIVDADGEAGGQRTDSGPRRQHSHDEVRGRPNGFAISNGFPWNENRLKNEKWPVRLIRNHRAVGELGNPSWIGCFGAAGLHALTVEDTVHLVGRRHSWRGTIESSGSPSLTIPPIARPLALGAGPVTSRERCRLVEEEQLRVSTWGHDRSMDAAKLEEAGDPTPIGERPTDRSGGIVEAAAVAHQRPRGVGGDQLSKGRYTVLSRRHLANLGAEASPCAALLLVRLDALGGLDGSGMGHALPRVTACVPDQRDQQGGRTRADSTSRPTCNSSLQIELFGENGASLHPGGKLDPQRLRGHSRRGG